MKIIAIDRQKVGEDYAALVIVEVPGNRNQLLDSVVLRLESRQQKHLC
jgi:hypothetical protein